MILAFYWLVFVACGCAMFDCDAEFGERDVDAGEGT